ncbi:MAG: hypothetical protein KJP07_10395 [Desulfatitalea sp.]|nr:hypothetical protein [Desulfatitalea sp.]
MRCFVHRLLNPLNGVQIRNFQYWQVSISFRPSLYPGYGAGSASYTNLTLPSFGGATFNKIDELVGMYTISASLAMALTPKLSVGLTGEILYGFSKNTMETDTYKKAIEGDDFGGSRVIIGFI